MLGPDGKEIGGDNEKFKEQMDQLGEQPQKQPPKTLMVISIDPKGNTFVSGPLTQKRLCIHHLCQAIEIIADYKPSPIIQPRGGIMGFARNLKRRIIGG